MKDKKETKKTSLEKDSKKTKQETKKKPISSKETKQRIESTENIMNIIELQKANIEVLYALAKDLDLPNFNQLKKNELIFKILQHQKKDDDLIKSVDRIR